MKLEDIFILGFIFFGWGIVIIISTEHYLKGDIIWTIVPIFVAGLGIAGWILNYIEVMRR